MRALLLFLINFYRRGISPAKPPCCRYTPTCSAYAYEAVERWGAVIGISLALARLARCNPLFPGGYDPVPERIHPKQTKHKQKR